MEFLKDLFGENGITYEDFAKLVNEKGYKLVDLSKGDYVAKKKYDDDLATANSKSTEWETKYAKLNESVKSNDVDFQKKYDELKANFDTLNGEKSKLLKENSDYKRKDIVRNAGITNDRLVNLALFELKDSENFEEDIKGWAKDNKALIGGNNKSFKMTGNPNEEASEDDKFFNAMYKAAGVEAKDVKPAE